MTSSVIAANNGARLQLEKGSQIAVYSCQGNLSVRQPVCSKELSVWLSKEHR